MTLHVHGLAFDVRMPFIKTEPNSNESPTNVPMASVSPLGHALHCLNARQLSHRQKPPPLPPYECPATNGSFCPATAHSRSNGTHHRQCSTAAIMSVQLPVLHHAAPTQPPTSTAPVSNIGTAPTSNVSAQPPTSTTPVTNTGVAPPNNVAAQPQAVAAASASNRGHRNCGRRNNRQWTQGFQQNQRIVWFWHDRTNGRHQNGDRRRRF